MTAFLRLTVLIVSMFLLGWAAAVAMDVAGAVLSGEWPDHAQLLAPIGGVRKLTFAVVMLAVLLADQMARRHAGIPDRRLLNGAGYNMPYLLADITGAMRAASIIFTLGLACIVLPAVTMLPPRLSLLHLPVLLQVPIAFAIGTFVHYWTHRFMHTKLMWPLHAVHHSDRDFGILTLNRRHPIEAFVFDLTLLPLIILFEFDVTAIVIAGGLSLLVNALQHSHMPCPRWVENWIVMGPATHRVHHAMAPEFHDRNFAALTIWDKLFGTFSFPEGARTVVTGIDDPRYDTGQPFRELVTSAAIWLQGLRHASHLTAMRKPPDIADRHQSGGLGTSAECEIKDLPSGRPVFQAGRQLES